MRQVIQQAFGPMTTENGQPMSFPGNPAASTINRIWAHSFPGQAMDSSSSTAALPATPIVLIGMPGVGKTTVGQLLARRTGRVFLDTDQVLETSTGRGLAELIATHGSAGFLALEGGALIEALTLSLKQPGGGVIATGGSAIYCSSEMQQLKDSCRIVHLDAPLALITRRAGDLDKRGVVRRPGESMEVLFAERTRLYRQYAHLSLSVANDSPAAVCEQLEESLAAVSLEPAGGCARAA